MGLFGLVPDQARSLRTLLYQTGADMRRNRFAKNKTKYIPEPSWSRGALEICTEM